MLGGHAAIEDRLAIGPAVVDAVQTGGSTLQVMPMARAIWLSLGSAARSKGDSLRLPGADMKGAITLQRRLLKATTLSPLRCLCRL
jgi:hypothetical protein